MLVSGVPRLESKCMPRRAGGLGAALRPPVGPGRSPGGGPGGKAPGSSWILTYIITKN
jgi:hypothetical protein